ncbi:(Fe-S)-binding protein [Desulfovibrio sp. JC010]|uniref:(Fe-S)-binding protein n=1 Tax=Desulfovibrio sp. JC010 TaxID=2593641 RepID=UPI0013D8538D|nr:(Fe-S)-binding protein [Desulfovibrio sp. JC010]NDV25841.1 (Fe-S)-binding protein [Desulfovibrio sp. JC010]
MPVSKLLRKELQHTADECIDCGKCMTLCRFLAESGSPVSIALKGLASDDDVDNLSIRSYDCSTCGLCSAVCPVAAQPERMFKELRNHAQANGLFKLEQHSPLLKYEKLGRRFPFKGEFIPDGCTTVFFPGCTLPAMHPDSTRITYKILKRNDPLMGLVLNCCSKPSKMLGLKSRHEERLSTLVHHLERKGVKKILTACPNCHVTFKEFNTKLEIVSIYRKLKYLNFTPVRPKLKEVTVHDPCVTRYETEMHKDVRALLKAVGVRVVEMKHNRTKTLCCGEGGATQFYNKIYAKNWSRKRITEAHRTGVPMVTYCAGCVNFLGYNYPTAHVLDILMVKRKGIPKPVAFPFNYLNRLILRFSAR